MRILFLSNYLPYPPDSGTKMRSLNFLKVLAGKGRVTLVAPGETSELAHCGPWQELWEKVILVDGRTFGPKKYDQSASVPERLRRLAAMEPWSMSDFISEGFRRELLALGPKDYDLIFIRYPQMAYYFLTDPELRGVLDKTVIDVDDVGILTQERRLQTVNGGYGKLRNTVDLLFLRNYYRKMAKVKACLIASEKDGRYLSKQNYAKKIFVVPNTIDVNGYDEPKAPGIVGVEILFCGTLSYPHNAEGLLWFHEKIFPLIRKEIPEARLVVIGKNPTEKILELASEPGVSVIGPVPSTQPFYERACITVVPLLNGAGTRIKILESMSFARPVVSTSVGAEGLDVTDGKDILIADRPELFATKCVELLKDAKKNVRIGREGYELVKSKYDQRVFHKRMEELFGYLQGVSNKSESRNPKYETIFK